MPTLQNNVDVNAEATPDEEGIASEPEHSEQESQNNRKRVISSEPEDAQGESQQSNLSVDQELGCGICLDTLTTPYTIIPCLHAFDKSCLVQWWKKYKNDTCPSCKKTATSAKSAFQLKSIIDRVHKKRKLSGNTGTEEIFPLCDSEQSDSDDSDESDDLDGLQTAEIMPPGCGLIWPCIACAPGNPTGYTCPAPLPEPRPEEIAALEALHPSWAPITAPLRGQSRTTLFSASQNGVAGANEHTLCVGCETYVPLGFPRAIKCTGCADVYCHNLDPQGCPGNISFSSRNELTLTPHDISTVRSFFPPLVKNNRHEMTRFTNYVASRDISVADILSALFEAKRDQTAEDTNEESADEHWGPDTWFCATCVNSVVSSMLFEWWMKERRASLDRHDDILPTKPDCWYGRECRTQTHNDSHAERLNHICENTRTRT